MTATASDVHTTDTALRTEITVWCDPSEIADIALRKARRPGDRTAAGQLLELAAGDRAVLRESMEHVVAGDSGAATQQALRLLFDAYQLASSH